MGGGGGDGKEKQAGDCEAEEEVMAMGQAAGQIEMASPLTVTLILMPCHSHLPRGDGSRLPCRPTRL